MLPLPLTSPDHHDCITGKAAGCGAVWKQAAAVGLVKSHQLRNVRRPVVALPHDFPIEYDPRQAKRFHSFPTMLLLLSCITGQVPKPNKRAKYHEVCDVKQEPIHQLEKLRLHAVSVQRLTDSCCGDPRPHPSIIRALVIP